MRQVIWVELRKVAPFYGVTALGLLGYVVLRRTVLTSTDVWLALGAAVHGAVVAWTLFADPGGTQAFMFSRAMTRRKLFLVRWGTGIGLLAATLVVTAGCLALGVREGFQMTPYYPMVKWFEFEGMWPLVYCSIVAYQVTMLGKVRGQLLRGAASMEYSGWATRTIGTVVSLFGNVLLFCAVLAHFVIRFFFGEGTQFLHIDFWFGAALAYAIALSVLGTLAGDVCYRKMEVDG